MKIPGKWSRYRLCDGLFDSQGRMYLSMPEPFGYTDLPDTIEHIVHEGDTLESLAARYYASLKNSPGLKNNNVGSLYWVIADFQPEPKPDCCYDPTLSLKSIIGQKLFIPGSRTVKELILSESRRPAFDG